MNIQGGTGIITAILLVGFILIAATAVSVIMRNSDDMSEQDLEEMANNAIDEISTYIQIKDVMGKYYSTEGEIWINGRNVTDLNLEHRNIGFAYQDYALYRHLPVRDNISFGLMWKNKKRKEIEKAVDQAIELLGLHNLIDKRPWSLSGGESQKIALARAIAIKPDLLILDEPLSAVDAETKEDYERELRELHNRLGLTTIHVTHSFEEAIALGDRIAVIMDGEILQVGTPEQIFRQP